MVFESGHHARFTLEDDCIPFLPYEVAQSTKGEPCNPVIEVISGEEFHGPGKHFIPAPVPSGEVAPGGPKEGQ